MKRKIIISAVFLCLLGSLLFVFRITVQQTHIQASFRPLSEKEWITLSSSSETLKRGSVQFYQRCKKCHGADATGGYKGPNLTDPLWIYGDSYNDIYHSIFYSKGDMKGYGKKLVSDDLHALTVYIKSLQK
ncbi:hypothetical protein DID78_01930 [Candidatus Marinamargulisbacteria bacterium SCGC AG-343-D04]|nr:hypothetical protein DID78_01930 [Candidatus Marinamargulisbacteria bacterium SCGC AG-343-D04]